MESQIAAGSKGSLTAIGTASKAFALAHPVGIAVVGGALVGAGVYYIANRWFKKPAEVAQTSSETVTA